MRLILFRGIALCLGVVVALLLGEVVLRAFDLAPSAGLSTVHARDFARLSGMLAANQRVFDRSQPALPYHASIDSLGFRGQNFPRAKQAGELRILLVGDSFTFGDYVDDEETLPAQLQRHLPASCGP